MTLKVGDLVTIVMPPPEGKKDWPTWNDIMDIYDGKTSIVVQVHESYNGEIGYRLDKIAYWYRREWLRAWKNVESVEGTEASCDNLEGSWDLL